MLSVILRVCFVQGMAIWTPSLSRAPGSCVPKCNAETHWLLLKPVWENGGAKCLSVHVVELSITARRQCALILLLTCLQKSPLCLLGLRLAAWLWLNPSQFSKSPHGGLALLGRRVSVHRCARAVLEQSK